MPARWSIPQSPGHFEEFVRAIKGGEPAMSNFPDYASADRDDPAGQPGRLGRGKKIEWDAKNLKVKNGREVAEKVEHIIRPVYRSGYSL